VTAELPTRAPYFGSWENTAEIRASNLGDDVRSKMPAASMTGVCMPNPKDQQIAQLAALSTRTVMRVVSGKASTKCRAAAPVDRAVTPKAFRQSDAGGGVGQEAAAADWA